MTKLLCTLAIIAVMVALDLPASAKYPEDLPAPEKAMSGTVDPWGLPFSDSLRRFDVRFAGRREAHFALGLTHSLVKVWPNKYWFRGESVPSSAAGSPARRHRPIWAAAGEVESFQVVVLPHMGAARADYSIKAEAIGNPGVAVCTYREYFVKTAEPGYPRYPVERWPDPLEPASKLNIGDTDCGVFWVDIRIPARYPGGVIRIRVTVNDGAEVARHEMPIRVVPGLAMDARAFPLVAWFFNAYGTKTLSDKQVRGMYALALAHHLQPLNALKGRFKPDNTADFDATYRFLTARGQRLFELDAPPKEEDYPLYRHVKAAGWLDRAIVYSNQDEPLAGTFTRENIPYCQSIRSKYPGLRVFLASQRHMRMAEGCDIWMTDLSTVGYHPQQFRNLKQPELWHYYCHLPIHVQFRAPLTQAPNMEVDCDALQHRLALWMSRYYGAKGVFIWAGFFASGLGDDFWKTLALETKPGDYPYGGIHNGNNYLVYPPQSDKGPVLPSIRLKVLRDGMEDLALIRAAEKALAEGRVTGAMAGRLRALLNPVPGIFVHPHYWDRLPETLLGRREAILKALSQIR